MSFAGIWNKTYEHCHGNPILQDAYTVTVAEYADSFTLTFTLSDKSTLPITMADSGSNTASFHTSVTNGASTTRYTGTIYLTERGPAPVLLGVIGRYVTPNPAGSDTDMGTFTATRPPQPDPLPPPVDPPD
jgi:hypothetical protein